MASSLSSVPSLLKQNEEDEVEVDEEEQSLEIEVYEVDHPEEDDDNAKGATSQMAFETSKRVTESSTLRFQNINFVVGKDKLTQKHILTNVNGCVHHGHVLAIMGPSGAGKTTLINVLTLDAFYGQPIGNVTLNGVPFTGNLFKDHCFVVKQQDKHWPYLTTRETLQYAAGLYNVGSSKSSKGSSSGKENIPILVDELIDKLGLTICADTRCVRLSGGQQRRLSIAIALLKKPTVLFLDEPTSGLDAAAASNIMIEITRVAKIENLIVICTIHQPSTKVYHGFDKVMILSRGKEAFTGNAHPEATEYFNSIGYPLPDATNPAEHFLDLVNSDFSGTEEVEQILDQWKQNKLKRQNTQYSDDDVATHVEQSGILNETTHEMTPYQQELILMFQRHLVLILRDPILYLGRCGIFLIMNSTFAFVYWNAKTDEIEQIYSKFWLQLWFVAVPANMGVVAVYALNDEFKSIQRESQNGMSRASTYILAKTFLVLPIFFVFGFAAIFVPAILIQGIALSSLWKSMILYAALMFVFESFAELLSVAFYNPILGMLGFMMFWFGSFLFGGFLIPQRDLYWPFELFYYIMPFGYYLRSIIYITTTETDWESTDAGVTSEYIMELYKQVYPVVTGDDTVWQDLFILIGIGAAWKVCYVILFITKTHKVATIQPPSASAAMVA